CNPWMLCILDPRETRRVHRDDVVVARLRVDRLAAHRLFVHRFEGVLPMFLTVLAYVREVAFCQRALARERFLPLYILSLAQTAASRGAAELTEQHVEPLLTGLRTVVNAFREIAYPAGRQNLVFRVME